MLRLFVVGFLVLFLELASIRWLAAHVVFLQFFTNVVLLAAFLGMSCGCLAARRPENWLSRFPFLALGAMLAAVGSWAAFSRWERLGVDVGQQALAQEVFFGTELQAPDVARFLVPIEWIAASTFVLVTLMFVGLGQALGRAFAAEPRRLQGYVSNVAGSLAGILAFALLSRMETPAFAWFAIVAGGVSLLLKRDGALDAPRAVALALWVLVTAHPGPGIRWSPYYAIDFDQAAGRITADRIAHQTIRPFATRGGEYSLVHLLRKHSGGRPFEDVLVIGAGTGNDVAHALRFGARRVDAVEIDPVIQDLGARFHGDRPYQDARVTVHLDDGRHFLRTTERRYDLVVYAVVDSLILHSGYANIRLESFLFTEEALHDVRRVLKRDGVFAAYNNYRQGWIVERVGAMAETAFGSRPLVFTIPSRDVLRAGDPVGAAVVVAGSTRPIAAAFERTGGFWLSLRPPRNLDVNGFEIDGDAVSEDDWHRLSPARVEPSGATAVRTTDDWPFLYIRDRLIPELTARSSLLLAALGLILLFLFVPDRTAGFDGRMFFLGAAFMLLEARAVVQMALLFGSTWTVNAFVIGAVLSLVLLANFYVLRTGSTRTAPPYAALLALCVLGALAPLETLSALTDPWRIVVPATIALAPIFFASVVFALSFRAAARPDHAFGMNVAGAVVGGFSEALSTLVGFRALLLLVALFALASIRRPRVGAGPATP